MKNGEPLGFLSSYKFLYEVINQMVTVQNMPELQGFNIHLNYFIHKLKNSNKTNVSPLNY